MSESYLHIDTEVAQSPKHEGQPCGDMVYCERDEYGTCLMVADGIGSGIKARIAAQMCVSRLRELIRLGSSFHGAFEALAQVMQGWRSPEKPFAAFSMARIRTDGQASILCYEAPHPVFISHKHSSSFVFHPLQLGGAVAEEASCLFQPGDALLMMSDGITQAGLGSGLPRGWKTEGVMTFLDSHLMRGGTSTEIAMEVHAKARDLWCYGGDDCTVLMASCRRGRTVNVFTGPPVSADQDEEIVNAFMDLPGPKIVCGGKTAEVVARESGKRLVLNVKHQSLVAPPGYNIDGFDLVSEGAVTLNQVYNILEEPIETLEQGSPVTTLCRFLQSADWVNIYAGMAKNSAHGGVTFRQLGVLTRDRIVPLIAEKLRGMGKLVVLKEI